MDPSNIRAAALDPDTVLIRHALATYASTTIAQVGNRLHLIGHLIGRDRRSGASPFGHGDDAAVAVSLLLRIAAQLLSGSSELIESKRAYAGAALVRQLVEVEYLAWAFETNDDEAARWLRSDKDERFAFFTPAKLRKSADGRFRSDDYGYHCEMGGHPVPNSWRLLNGDEAMAQLILSDCLGHVGRIWDHVTGWFAARGTEAMIASEAAEMSARFGEWKRIDPLTSLPAPPLS